MSMPRVWNENVHDALNVDPILAAPKPTEGIGQYQVVARNGAAQDANGNWIEAWEIRDMFSDGDQGTKAEQEAAYQTQLDNEVAKRNRNHRDILIAATDWWASSDLTMSSAQNSYRQALRDITAHSNWPHVEETDWPTKP
jgi:hypothetical protein